MQARPKSAAVGAAKRGQAPWATDEDDMIGSRYIHDPMMYSQIKFDKSDPYFRNTKVSTCSHILKRIEGNGKAIAVAYPLEKTGWKHPASYQNLNKSSETQSMAAAAFKKRETEHCGALKKKLQPYHPNASRSRLPVATVVMPYKNSSQIVIGDRSNQYNRHFVTTNANKLQKPDYTRQ